MRLENKVAVITGAASGIGKALAQLFVKEGAKVVGVDLNEDSMKEMENEMQGSFVAFSGDISLQETNERMIDKAIKVFGKVDILINNAGVVDQGMTVKNMTNNMWDRTMKINVTGPLYAMRYFIQKKIELGEAGSIVSTSSVGGMDHPTICGAAYAASKAALIQLTKHTAYSFGKQNIRCNAICVGACPSTGIASTFTNPDMEGMEKSMLINSLSIRDAEAIELAQAILYLASDDASYVNGSILNVDGGWSCA